MNKKLFKKFQIIERSVQIGIALVIFCFSSTSASAQKTNKELFFDPSTGLGGNIGVVSNYLFRGQTQSDNLPAFQGGLDFEFEKGLFIGNWNSISFNNNPIENDLFIGYELFIFQKLKIIPMTTVYLYPVSWKDNSAEVSIEFDLSYAGLKYSYDYILQNHYTESGVYFNIGKSVWLSGIAGILVNSTESANSFIFDTEVAAGFKLGQRWNMAGKYTWHENDKHGFAVGLIFSL